MNDKIKKLLFTIFAFVFCIVFFIIYAISSKKGGETAEVYKESVLKKCDVVYKTAELDEYTIYGTHMNIKGTLNKTLTPDAEVSLVLKTSDDEAVFKLSSEFSSAVNFDTGDKINEGINLDSLDVGEYYVLLKVSQNQQTIYYSLNNTSKYGEYTYYTVTDIDKKTNNKIEVQFQTDTEPYMKLCVSESKLPDDVYDIVIDPGHGGSDPGTDNSDYTEAEMNLTYGLLLKSALEDEGYKVNITRDGEEGLSNYGENGRVFKICSSNAKYNFSMHLNNSDYSISQPGVEIYAPVNSSLNFAQSLADNIVEYAKTNYSSNKPFRVSNGVYVRGFMNSDILAEKADAEKYKYDMYESITTDTNYYFMIRETGGIMTGAFVDGRNTNNGENKYFDSNIGTESYLLELGYMRYTDDFDNILNNKKGYIDGIVNAIKSNTRK